MKSTYIYLSIAFILTLTSSCFSTKNIPIIKNTNDKYYNLAKYGLRSFKCKIEDKEMNEIFDYLRDKLSDDYPIASAKNTQFLATIKAGGHVDIEILHYFDLKAEKFNKDLKHMINGAKGIISSALGVWGTLTFDPMFPESKHGYKVTSDSDYYFIKVSDNNDQIIAKLTKNLKLIETIYENEQNTFRSLQTDFTETEKGYLLQEYRMRLNEDNFESNVKINYEEIEGFFIPKSISILNIRNGKHQNINLLISDHLLEIKK